ncbi:alanine--tRNA ligase [Loigolactobacillus backii]|uniref:alanine--tRNA ligase n=1 Tax=Loigolactobacillus backii TaxID=375175 RepID=UPI000C1C89A0|nr:alanine--tRNA ligase [Loigolactobacillus backii]PIO83085.1 alanine--tRNA ligase [Loigolactobacillus backii]
MKKLSSSQIRQMYLDFFKEKGHTVEPSASLVPVDDPTLLWINSGVATMKKYFDGRVVPENPRLTSSQKSIRTNDIENVGKTARHQTLFEMLGNFSVGDYFKKEAIPWAWEFLTSPKWMAFAADKLYITVYPEDKLAKQIWKETGVKPAHIIEDEDNFWDIGEGPSGPDSEIFYDRGQEFNNVATDDPENYPGGENERYLEVWNIVFSEFNHKPDGSYEPLPHKNIDTGMGLERLVSVVQGAKTNFETDLFLPIIHATEKMSDAKVYGKDEQDDVSFKVIADHSRAVTFAIGDGALPSNEGRGYVLRRLIRRATVHGKKLGINEPFLYKLVPVVGKIMESYYPEILQQSDYIAKIIKSEEDRFNNTLTDGLKLLDKEITTAKKQQPAILSGAAAFKLFDTYGFPFDLTKEYAGDEGLAVDEAGFNAEMKKQKERARAARSQDNGMGVQSGLLLDVKTTSKFIGWDHLSKDQATLAVIVANDQIVDQVTTGTAELIFDETPFYAEMGGQVADQGVIQNEAGQVVAVVTDVQHAPNGQNLHTVDVKAPLKKGEHYQLKVDQDFRRKVSLNHTATHLLDQALRDVLGEHVRQAGSLVEPDYLRFDFTHSGQTTAAELAQIEQIINEKIWAALPISWVVTDIESAKKLGAIALFTEKYGKEVRVVSIGDYSKEFDGGTHAKNTAELGLFKITGETGTGAGIRRIEAVTSKAAYSFLNEREQWLQQAATELKTTQLKTVPTKVVQLQEQLRDANKQIESLQAKSAQQQASDVFKNVQEINGTSIIAEQVKVADMKQLRQLADDWKQKAASDVLVLGTVIGAKVNLIAAVSPAGIKAGLKAGDLIKAIAPKVGGGGGGRPDMAQAGGKNPAGLQDALKASTEFLQG